MQRSLALIAIALLTLAGCGTGDDPANARLRPGQTVVTIEPVILKPPEGEEFLASSQARKTPMLRPAERAEVLTDESAIVGPKRPVKVKVLTDSDYASGGRLKGEICTIERQRIRAIHPE